MNKLIVWPMLTAIMVLAVCQVAAAASSSASLTVGYPSGFAGAAGAFQFNASAGISGSNIALVNGSGHSAGQAWYKTQQNTATFATQFEFQISAGLSPPSITGFAFVVQNSTNGPNNQAGLLAGGDANVCGYGWFTGGPGVAMNQSMAITFNLNPYSTTTYGSGNTPSSVGLWLNGAPPGQLFPLNDLNPNGINLYSGHIFKASIVYDGSQLVMTLLDTTTNAQARFTWPLNLTTQLAGNAAYVGFTAGEVSSATIDIHNWNFYQGYNPRLPTPTFSMPAGQYSSAQTVSLTGPTGASIYYTTNGLDPTTSSTPYTGPITVSATEVVKAIAVKPDSTDSFVSSAYYQISASAIPAINFPSGFANATNLVQLVGYAKSNGSAIQLTDTNGNNESAAAWFKVPVNVETFSTTFQLQLTSAKANGMMFVIQNKPTAAVNSPTIGYVSGGFTALGMGQQALGYSSAVGGAGVGSTNYGLVKSVAVKFDLYTSPGNTTGLYLNGADPESTGQIGITGVNLNSGHPLKVTLSYNGTTLSMTITDTVTLGKFSTSWAVNIPSIVGGSTAFVGFTGGTGGLTARQDVLTWTYSSSTASQGQPAVPAAPTNFSVH